jgi:hypothetical protein
VQQDCISGSFNTDKFHENSNLILICCTDEPFVERGRSFLDVFDPDITIELFVYTPEEWQQIQRAIGFWKSAFATIKQIL